MKLPQLRGKRTSISVLNTFLGYNHNMRIKDGEFYDMQNLSTDYFPLMGIRERRAVITHLKNPKGLHGGDNIAYIDENKLYYDYEAVCDLDEKYAENERKFAMIGAYLCIFPDKIIYNTYTGEVDRMECEVTTAQPPQITLCKLDGTVFDDANTSTGNTEPDKEKYKYWIDTSEKTTVMKMWSSNSNAWEPVGTTYVKVAAPGIGKGFKQYDGVTFSGMDVSENVYNGYDFNQTNILHDVKDDYVVIVGFINKAFQNSKNVTLKRSAPDMDFVAEMDNRIWGCSSEKHEIYACKQGDPKNWNCFMSIASDSYAATVGTDGDFTGSVNYMGTVYFFKENGVHIIYGQKPSNFQINWKVLRGVQKGSEKSIVLVGEQLYYKSREGVCVFNGGNPENISNALGKEPYYDAVAGELRGKYYISMRTAADEFHMFMYDSKKGMWMKENDTVVKFFCFSDGGLYLINKENTLLVINSEEVYAKLYPMMIEVDEKYCFPRNDLYPGDAVESELEEKIAWSATTGELGLDSPYVKYIKQFRIRLQIDIKAWMRVEVMYDSSGVWEELVKYYATRKKMVEIPVRVRRCDHLQLRFSGEGDVLIYSIAKEYEETGGRT